MADELLFTVVGPDGRLTVSGPLDLARAFPTWGGLSYYANVKPAARLGR